MGGNGETELVALLPPVDEGFRLASPMVEGRRRSATHPGGRVAAMKSERRAATIVGVLFLIAMGSSVLGGSVVDAVSG
jgi:hypothetical protein